MKLVKFLFLCCTILVLHFSLHASTLQDIKDSRYENRQYRNIILPNGIKALLISDPNIEKASVAINVQVGSFHDPQDREGMAHFLEHLLFLGTKKYPKVGEFEKFLGKHGGYGNAFTANQSTAYFFEVNPQYLREASDRLSQFFIAPLFNSQFVESESKIVHSEFSNHLSSNTAFVNAAIRDVLNPQHQMAKFAVGNAQTLDKISRQEVIDFYHQNYSSHLMTLAIIGRESLNQLQDFALDYFAKIPKRTVKPLKFGHSVLMPAQGVRFLQVKPPKEAHELILSFYLPPANQYYRSLPIMMIGSLLGREGKGSLFEFLKKKNLVLSLNVSPDFVTQVTSLDIYLKLTKNGVKNYRQVVHHIFEYIKLLRQKGLPKTFFNDVVKISDLEFQYQGKIDGVNATLNPVMMMQIMPSYFIYKPASSYMEFKPKVIDRFLFRLKPENLLVVLVDPSVKTKSTAPIFGTKYTYQSHDKKWLNSLKNIQKNKSLKLPVKNQWLPDSLAILPKETEFYFSDASLLGLAQADLPKEVLEKLQSFQSQKFQTWHELQKASQIPDAFKKKVMNYAFSEPKTLMQCRGTHLWFAQDIVFDAPKSGIRLLFHTPKTSQGLRPYLLGKIYASIIREKLNAWRYELLVAGVTVDLFVSKKGLFIHISGYSDKLWNVLDFLVRRLHDVKFSQQRFQELKNESLRQWRNVFKEPPLAQTGYFMSRILYDSSYSVQEHEKALKTIRLSDVQKFGKNLLNQAFIEAFAYGNLDPKITRLAVTQSLQKLKLKNFLRKIFSKQSFYNSHLKSLCFSILLKLKIQQYSILYS